MKTIKRKFCVTFLAYVIVVAVFFTMNTQLIGMAAGCSFTFTDAEVEVGETFNITLTWNTTDSDLGGFTAELSYDSSYLELVSGDLILAPLPQTASGVKNVVFVYSFKALKEGTTTVSLIPGNAYSFSTLEKLESTVNAGTITITEQPTDAPTDAPTEAPTDPPTEAPTDPPTEAPTVPPTEAPTEPPTEAPTVPPTEAPTTPPETLSSNAKLDALSIHPGTLSPAFSTDVHWYDVYVDNDVTSLTVDAVTSDENATWVPTEGRKDLKVGKNYVGVKVTAQDGSVEWYEMYVYRAAAETDAPTEAPTDEPTEAPTNRPTEAPTNEPTTDAQPSDPLAVVIGNVNGKIQQTLGDVSRPEGFEETTYNYKGVNIEALKGLGKDLLLIPVSDGTKTALCLYNEDNGGFYPYVGIQVTSALYTVLPFPANETAPTGYSLTTIEFQGTLIDAWVRNDAADKNYSVFYAMNWNGETALYRYDAGEKTLQRVVKSELAVGSGGQIPTIGTEGSTGSNGNHQVSDDYLEYYEETLQRVNRRDTFMFILMVVLLICMVAMYLLFVVGKDDKDAKEDENESDDEEADENESDEDEGLDDEELNEDDKALQHELEDIQVGMADFMADLSETDEASAEIQLDDLQDDDLEDLDLNNIK